MNSPIRLMIPQGSPKIHPRRVKLGKRENSINIKKNHNSLFMFLSFTPTPSRDARPCVFACVRETGGERVKHEPCRPGSPTLVRVAPSEPDGTTLPPVANRRQGRTWAKFPPPATVAARHGSSLADLPEMARERVGV